MDPLLGGIISGGASLLGSVFSSQQSAQNVQAQISAQQGMQQQAEAYNTQMSNTAYQRASADMKKAGLNPMMMFGQGGPASSPTIGTPTVPMPTKTSPLAGLGDAANHMLTGAVQAKTLDMMTDQIAKLQAERGLVSAEAGAATARTGLTTAETDTERARKWLVSAQEFSTNVDAKLRSLGIDPAKVSQKEAQSILAIPQTPFDVMSQAAWYGRKGSNVIDPIATGVGSATGAGRLWQSLNPKLPPYMSERESTTVRPGGKDTTRERWYEYN